MNHFRSLLRAGHTPTLVEMELIVAAMLYGFFFVLAMGLVHAGNVGTAVSVLVAPPLAQWLGWQAVHGVAAVAILLPILAVVLFAKEPPDMDSHAKCRDHIACLFEKDGWVFSLVSRTEAGLPAWRCQR